MPVLDIALDFAEVVLLGTDDASGSHDAEPAHGLARCEPIMVFVLRCNPGTPS
jgi:hypothetical protein